jgi:hypothetical protein
MSKEYRLEWSTNFQVLEDKVNQAVREGYAILGTPQIAKYEKETLIVQGLVKIHRHYVTDPNRLLNPGNLKHG